MKCRFEHRGDCCNSGSPWYLSNCEQPCDTIIPMTNADRIRAMSDEELAHIMIQFTDLDSRIGYCAELPECHALLDTEDGIPASKCEQCLINWLQQPAEVE